MFDYLIDHAIKNVWCTPDQDNQVIISPHRITPSIGALNYYKVMWRDIQLPEKSIKWHLFQVGQLHPLLLNLKTEIGKWISFADASNSRKVICDIYNDAGVQFPRFETYYMFTSERDLVIAIKENSKILADFQNDTMYFRVYSNAYFNSMRADATTDTVAVFGTIPTSMSDLLSFQGLFQSYSSKNGLTYGFVNGMLVDKIDAVTCAIGDSVEFVYDASIIRKVEFNLKDLNTFTSTLDGKLKYILHYSKASDDGTIDYLDDNDIFILDNYNGTRFNGVYYHRNMADAARMVTHRDYSITVPYVVNYTTKLAQKALPRVMTDDTVRVRLHVRKSGYLRPLTFESNRIEELYKLTDPQIMNAFMGIDSTVSNWRAEVLENSAYTKLMGAQPTQINRQMIQDAYGYNAISKIVGNTPAKTFVNSSRQEINVPYGLQNGATAYEYNSDRLLTGFYFHPQGSVYAAADPSTAYVEMISGTGSDTPGVVFGTDNIPLPNYADFRVYVCTMTANGPDGNWTDITGTNQYTVVNNTLIWANLETNQYLMVRTDDEFLAYDLNLPVSNGVLSFTLMETNSYNGVTGQREVPVPMGELDIFLNGRSLIEGLDYFVQFPHITVINKEYLVNPETDLQSIHVRGTGFCNSDLTRDPIDDVGFIQHGVLSNNSKFDIRDDKVLRIIVDGQIYLRSELKFSETTSGVSIVNPINGKPYMVRDIVVPLRDLTDENTYTLRAAALVTDKAVSDYLTLKIPQPPRDDVSSIPNRYEVYSPFISRIVMDLASGVLNDPLFSTNYSDNDVINICAPYLSWLPYDPINGTINLNEGYVVVHPTNRQTTISLGLYQYRFLMRVVKLYGNGLIDLSPFITLASAT